MPQGLIHSGLAIVNLSPYLALVQSIYEKYLANPPQIATEAIPTVLCSEQPPESQKKSLGKSKWWNIVKIIYIESNYLNY